MVNPFSITNMKRLVTSHQTYLFAGIGGLIAGLFFMSVANMVQAYHEKELHKSIMNAGSTTVSAVTKASRQHKTQRQVMALQGTALAIFVLAGSSLLLGGIMHQNKQLAVHNAGAILARRVAPTTTSSYSLPQMRMNTPFM